MNYKEFLEKREKLIRLITTEKTGSAEVLAHQLHCSRRTIFNYIELLNNEGMCIKFCRTRNTYYFYEV